MVSVFRGVLPQFGASWPLGLLLASCWPLALASGLLLASCWLPRLCCLLLALAGLLLASCWLLAGLFLASCWPLAGLLLAPAGLLRAFCWALAGFLLASCFFTRLAKSCWRCFVFWCFFLASCLPLAGFLLASGFLLALAGTSFKPFQPTLSYTLLVCHPARTRPSRHYLKSARFHQFQAPRSAIFHRLLWPSQTPSFADCFEGLKSARFHHRAPRELQVSPTFGPSTYFRQATYFKAPSQAAGFTSLSPLRNAQVSRTWI